MRTVSGQQLETMSWLLPRSQFREVKGQQTHLTIYVEEETNTRVAQRIVSIPTFEYLRQKELYEWRFATELAIPRVFHAQLLKERRESTTVSIFLQTLQQNLQDLTQVSINDALYILRTCLSTAERLVAEFGYFSITPFSVGFDQTNKCYLWINSDHSLNRKEASLDTEQAMVKQIFQLLQCKVEKLYQNCLIFEKAKTQAFTFQKGLIMLAHFAYQEQISIPNQSVTRRASQTPRSRHFRMDMTDKLRMCKSSFQNPEVIEENQVYENPRTLTYSESSFKNQGLKFMRLVKKVRSQNINQLQIFNRKINELPTRLHKTNELPLFQKSSKRLMLPKQTMKISSQHTVHSTEASVFECPLPTDNLQNEDYPRQKNKQKKYQILKSEHIEWKDKSTRCPAFLTKNKNKKRSPSKDEKSFHEETMGVSNCWSETDAEEKNLVEECLSKNRWSAHITNLFDGKCNMKDSVHIEDEKEEVYRKKLQQLKKLRINNFGGSQQVFESIMENESSLLIQQ